MACCDNAITSYTLFESRIEFNIYIYKKSMELIDASYTRLDEAIVFCKDSFVSVHARSFVYLFIFLNNRSSFLQKTHPKFDEIRRARISLLPFLSIANITWNNYENNRS